jgi:hypothetical protein
VPFDENDGYFPPAPSNPPTRAPLLGLLEQARAFGVSVVLATQNPVDLDSRGLGNIGTWWVGRLQTERDRQRIRDALASAAAATGVTPAKLPGLISTLEPRQFLLHSVHRAQPSCTGRGTRTRCSTVRYPRTRCALTAPMKAAAPASEAQPASDPHAPVASVAAAAAPGAPDLTIPAGLDPDLGPIFEKDRRSSRSSTSSPR